MIYKNFAISAVLLTIFLGTAATADIITSFDVDLSPDSQNFATASAASLSLNYTIDGSGNVLLDAVALQGNGNSSSPARWNQVDNSNAGTTDAASLFNTSFTLTYSGSADALLNYPSYDNAGSGAVLVTNEGNNKGLEDGENVAFTVSGTATSVSGFALNLNSFSYDNRLANGQSSFGVQDTNGNVIEQLIPNTSLDGTIAGSGISLTGGQTMTFRTIAGNAGGAGLSGFNFDVVAAVPEPSSAALFGVIGTLALLRRRR